ncbi:MAG TPA: Glu/Leu/Phe/Val dehydrogenase, partial [Chitinophagales bacterium]|nr:Glu/Leu/Phe/Val dehydrogenase [Chitinophagales bacterium]
VRFGRMEHRFQESTFSTLVELIEKNTGRKISAKEKEIIHGAQEIDIVRSGLEDTMIHSYEAIHEIWKKKKIKTIRTAAFVNALNKIGTAYLELGVFP